MLVPQADVDDGAAAAAAKGSAWDGVAAEGHILHWRRMPGAQDLSSPLGDAKGDSLDYVPVTPMNIHELRSMNLVLFPMSYQEKYYRDVLALDSLARLIYWGGRMVATFSCKLQPFYTDERPQIECYIMTFGVLAPYRRLHLGTAMLKSIIEYYRRRREVRRIMLHVHTANEAAAKFYLQHGFCIVQTLPNYYRRLAPSSAFLLCLDLP